MTKFNESPSWEEEIELIARGERVSGGQDGVANRPLKVLVNRTRHLKEKSDEMGGALAGKVEAINNFAEGATLNSPREEILDGTYRLVWTGAFPKAVPANSSPASTGGVGPGAWAYTSDVAIRRELASEDAAAPGGAKVFLKQKGTVQDAINYVTPFAFKNLVVNGDWSAALVAADLMARDMGWGLDGQGLEFKVGAEIVLRCGYFRNIRFAPLVHIPPQTDH
ncbi:hypothetical protein PTQ46_27880 [Klebsiella michiganensis]|uniref:tail fiber/spike domain-containing protein n=1 Tax=Klebsiella michiganensis TaxID=1134687 RepID=UPI00287E22D8|nr:hypothetical protein [Klebsiella michiganensis]MDS7844023.1 hypothetical protein [Klebsiella michiganensis]